jgi:hypothetical protein
MPQYVIERPLPGAHRLSQEELQAIAQKSNSVLRELGPDIQWVHSFVAEDKIFCVYNAKNPELIREHARCGGFPCEKVARVQTIIDPNTGE